MASGAFAHEAPSCDYGHSGSRRAACDRDATDTRGGFNYCATHVEFYDWAEAHQLDEDLYQGPSK